MEMASFSEMLKTLIEEYQFNINTLSKYLELSEEQIDSVKRETLIVYHKIIPLAVRFL